MTARVCVRKQKSDHAGKQERDEKSRPVRSLFFYLIGSPLRTVEREIKEYRRRAATQTEQEQHPQLIYRKHFENAEFEEHIVRAAPQLSDRSVNDSGEYDRRRSRKQQHRGNPSVPFLYREKYARKRSIERYGKTCARSARNDVSLPSRARFHKFRRTLSRRRAYLNAGSFAAQRKSREKADETAYTGRYQHS